MSGQRSCFSSFKGDRRPIRLADGMIVYSESIGTVRFLSSHGFSIIIHDILYVPSLSISLFSPNKFAREHRRVYREVLEYPKRSWVNRHTGAVEFSATIRPNNLAYLDWEVDQQMESACVSLEEMHARLNHMPYQALWQLVRNGSVGGIPDDITDMQQDDSFCEDCTNGKLTRAPHSKSAVRAQEPLTRVYTDVHGPVQMHSRRGNCYWVTFIDDHSRFPAVYFIRRKSRGSSTT